jgi:hypothetical protein
MSYQIKFFLKNAGDFSANPNVTATASQGNSTAANVLDRKNTTAWLTSGSVDADLTTLIIDFVDPYYLTDLLLVKHNFKSYKVEYWDGAAYQAFPTPVDETVNTALTTHHSFAGTTTTKIKLTVRLTTVVNDDKTLYQFIATELLGQLNGWPPIKKPTVGKNKRRSGMLSGKAAIARNLGGVSFGLDIPVHSDTADIDLLADLFDRSDGFLVWPCGGSESQFTRAVEPYRLQDIYCMACQDDFNPEWYGGMYKAGMHWSAQFVEVND